MLDALELDPTWLPRTLESPEVSGTTAAGVPVAAGAGDQAAAALGVLLPSPFPINGSGTRVIGRRGAHILCFLMAPQERQEWLMALTGVTLRVDGAKRQVQVDPITLLALRET